MTYRIKQVISPDGTSAFIPQRRLFFPLPYRDICYHDLCGFRHAESFTTLDAARRFVSQRDSHRDCIRYHSFDGSAE